jgi:hypothetical protein
MSRGHAELVRDYRSWHEYGTGSQRLAKLVAVECYTGRVCSETLSHPS